MDDLRQPTDEPTEADPPELDLAELRRLHEAGTPGPWRPHDTWLDHGGHTAVVFRGNQNAPPGEPGRLTWLPTLEAEGWGTERNVWNDADLIVAMRNALPELLDEIDRLRALVGGRSAAPTREQDDERPDDSVRRTSLGAQRLVAAIDAHVAKTHEPLAAGKDPAVAAQLFSEDSIELLLKAREVVALLSRSAAEPPGPERNELLRLLDHFDRYVSSPDQTGYVGTPFYDEIQAALAGYRSADGVAAGPKEHDDE